MKRDGSRHQALAVMRRISTLGRPRLISRHKGLPVARKSFRHRGRCTSLSAPATLSSALAQAKNCLMAAWSSTAEQNTPPAACRGGATQSPKMAVIFLGESRIVGQLGQAHLVWLQAALVPNPLHRCFRADSNDVAPSGLQRTIGAVP
jgi:hypothetical protein